MVGITLKEVLNSLVHERGEKYRFLEEFLGETILSQTLVIEVARDGKSLNELENMFDITPLDKLNQLVFRAFVRECCDWSRQGHKRRRKELPHERFSGIGSPSTFGGNSTGGWAEKQKILSLEIMCCRPASSSWINLCIMHPAFVEMSRALEEKSVPEASDFCLARVLTQVMPSSYVVEGSRRDEINRILNERLFMNLTPKISVGVTMVDNSYDTDVSISQCGFNVEYKNEKGQGKSDPYMQNIGYYVKYWSSSDGPTKHCCPWILMEVIGQEIGLSVAAWAAGRPTCQPICTNVPFLPVPGDRRLFLSQARLCMALRVGVTCLLKWYKLSHSVPPSPQANFPFPRQAKFQGMSQEIEFEYMGVYGNGEEHRKMLFVGKRSDTNEEVLIKFAPNPYGKEVHETLAASGHAPILHDVRQETGLCMVVMELIRASRPISNLDTSDTRVEGDLEKIQAVLSSRGFVHGDLRSPNVHIKEDKQVVLFDFDWAGKEGEAKYPDMLNPCETWPPGAQLGALITKEHDQFMIANLSSKL